MILGGKLYFRIFRKLKYNSISKNKPFKIIIQIKCRSYCFESKIIQWSFIGHWSGYIVSNCEHACILTQDGWGRPILTELMIFDQNLNFNRVTIIIIRIFYKLIWWFPTFPQIFSKWHETFLILKVTDLRCLLKGMACVRILVAPMVSSSLHCYWPPMWH